MAIAPLKHTFTQNQAPAIDHTAIWTTYKYNYVMISCDPLLVKFMQFELYYSLILAVCSRIISISVAQTLLVHL